MRKAKVGWTLIELLLSTLIFSILVLSIASIFHTGILSYNRIDSSFDTYQTARRVLNRIALDLSNSFNYLTDDSKWTGDKQRIEFFTVLDLFDEQGESCPSVCRVIYESDDKILRRTLLKGIDALRPGAIAEKSEPVRADLCVSPLLEDISFNYAYNVEDDLFKAFDWQELWPVQNDAAQSQVQKESRPLAVKVKLSLTENVRGQGRRTIEFNKLVSL